MSLNSIWQFWGRLRYLMGADRSWEPLVHPGEFIYKKTDWAS